MAEQRQICVYQTFDPATLEPDGAATRSRIDELSVLAPMVAGRTVLDIGCNAGLVSILCARWGARRVSAINVDRANVAALQQLAVDHSLDITARVRSFDQLEPPDDEADVVLMLEVIHWLVAQGNELAPVIDRLSRLTRNVLVIETPWSVDEPSIRQQTTLSHRDYGMDLIVESLLRHFASVEFVHFSRYFSADGDSKRALLLARRSRSRSATPDRPAV